MPQISVNDLKNGITLELDNGLFQVVEFQHVKPGKGGAFVRTKIRNVRSGAVIDKTFNAGIKVEQAIVDRQDMQFLYKDGDDYVFMNTSTYDQMNVPNSALGEAADYLTEQMIADGNRPWCVGIESGAATGWTGSDFIQDILLVQQGHSHPIRQGIEQGHCQALAATGAFTLQQGLEYPGMGIHATGDITHRHPYPAGLLGCTGNSGQARFALHQQVVGLHVGIFAFFAVPRNIDRNKARIALAQLVEVVDRGSGKGFAADAQHGREPQRGLGVFRDIERRAVSRRDARGL